MTDRRLMFCASALCAGLAAPVLAQDATQRVLEKTPPPVSRQIETAKPEINLEAVRPIGESVDCAAFIEDLWSYVNANKGASEGAHRIGAKMARVKIQSRATTNYPWGHSAYSEGAFGWSGDSLVGRFKVLFSDRKSAAGARFDAGKADIEDVTLYKDGHIEIMLRGWGNAVLKPTSLRCYPDGFVTGIIREDNGVSMVSFALRKEQITPGSHPASLWP
ncbi:MAG: hypothetical protein GC153_03690 [Alphaproteobacteria bacterium]|nr:hypothetical protein [Alphaproteobacteria bacterium]